MSMTTLHVGEALMNKEGLHLYGWRFNTESYNLIGTVMQIHLYGWRFNTESYNLIGTVM